MRRLLPLASTSKPPRKARKVRTTPRTAKSLSNKSPLAVALRTIGVTIGAMGNVLGRTLLPPRTRRTLPLSRFARLRAIATNALQTLWPKTLFARALLIIVVPLIAVQIAAAYAFFNRHWTIIAQNMASAIASEMNLALDMMRDDPESLPRLSGVYEKHLNLPLSLFRGQTIDPQSAQTQRFGFFTRHLGQALQEKVKRPFVIDTESFSNQVVVQLQLAEGVLQTVIPRERLFSATTYIFVMWMVGSSILLFSIAALFMRNQVRPLRHLERVADQFGKGHDTTERIDSRGAREVRNAIQAFNRMRRRIFRQIRQRTDMLSGVSHDLRTPLTRIKLQVAMSRDPLVRAIEGDVKEMEAMIEGYLAFARSEGSERVASLDLTALIDKLIRRYQRSGSRLYCHMEGRFVIIGRENALRRCLDNLLSNAHRYGNNVSVLVGRRREHIEILVDDDGPGIPNPYRNEVFRPFFRLESSRSQETGGTGLGLSIARDIARIHGGDLTLDSSPQGGLRANLQIPL